MQKNLNTLHNGLTPEAVSRIRAVLKKVNLSTVCQSKNVSRYVVENVLRGKSPRLEDLNTVLEEAKRVIREREAVIKSLIDDFAA